MNYGLPQTVNVNGKEQEIRSDYRVMLEIFEALNDPELTQEEKAEAVITMFYMKPEDIEDYGEAIERCFEFADGGKKQEKKPRRIIDWEKDYEFIISPVNRVLGYEVRSVPYDPLKNIGGVHWWTFLSAFMEIGPDCILSTIIRIRDKQQRGAQLTKEERKWANQNAALLQIKTRYSQAEESLIKEWAGGE